MAALDGELLRTLLTNLDGGISTFRVDSAEVGPFDPQEQQEQGPVDEKQRGKNATTLCIAEARRAASNSF